MQIYIKSYALPSIQQSEIESLVTAATWKSGNDEGERSMIIINVHCHFPNLAINQMFR